MQRRTGRRLRPTVTVGGPEGNSPRVGVGFHMPAAALIATRPAPPLAGTGLIDWMDLYDRTSGLVRMRLVTRRQELHRIHRDLDLRLERGGNEAVRAMIERGYLYGVEDVLDLE